MRRDTRRNIKRLVWAVGEVAKADGASLSMNAVAARAEIAQATAYRYFASVDRLVEAFRVEVVSVLADYSEALTETGAELYHAVLSHWYQLVLEHGSALVQLRSRRGFLDRLRDGDALIAQSCRAWERPIRELLASEGIEQSDLEIPMFLCNIINDPRELLDLTAHSGAKPQAIISGLQRSAVGAIRGWIGAQAR